ncbi:hypothetical protein [Alkalihalobacillus trypoxylicola]|uniref:hypothetical protein n=1 Tax=Alkalihalobacillus trypoxylicola TaxID=519424 RepID=UPI000B2AD5F1|nr:hypothetical protein [Alkalihalobacillus trypoxylicola]
MFRIEIGSKSDGARWEVEELFTLEDEAENFIGVLKLSFRSSDYTFVIVPIRKSEK